MGRFFLWCAGVRQDWLEPGLERQRYMTMGASIVLASVLAAVAMWVLTGYVLPDAPLPVRIGASAIWAAVMFVLDRTIAVVMVTGGFFRRMFGYLPRLAFAVIAAFLVSEPLVLAVYDKEVTQFINKGAEDSRQARIDAASAEPRFIAPDDEVVAAQGEVTRLEGEITSLNQRAVEEERGDGATGIAGCRKECLKFRGLRVAAQRELDDEKATLATAIGTREGVQAQLDSQRNAFVETEIQKVKDADGIAARHTALTNYLASSPGANLVRWAIAAALLLADLAVVFFKLIGAETGHDKRERHRIGVLDKRLGHEMAAIDLRGAEYAKAKVAADAVADATIEAWERADRVGRAELRFAHVSEPRSAEADVDDDTPVATAAYSSGADPGHDPIADPAPGAIVNGNAGKGPYRLERQIGSGGYGTVFKARDLRDDSEVAAKFIKAEDQDSWRREVSSMSQLDHQHIATVLDVPQFNDEWLCVVYPLYRPGSLADVRGAERIGRPGRKVSLGFALRVTDQILYALSQAHDHGIVHRDVKPGNVLLDQNNVRVSDWGRAHGRQDSSRSPALADWKWTAPEVVTAAVAMIADPSDSRSDLYSTAAVLYWLITGDAPLVREMTAEAIQRGPIGRQMAERRQLVPERVDEYDERIPAEVATLLAQWLHRDPVERGSADSTTACRVARKHLTALLETLPESRLNRIDVGGPWLPAAAAAPPPGRGAAASAPDGGETPYE